MVASAGPGVTFRQNFARYLKPFSRGALTFWLVMVTTVVPALAAAAAAGPPPTCDPKYWDSIKAKAWTEAEREIEQNQNLIYKADSVLEYTCFDQFSRTLAGHADQLFSETTKWGTISGPDMAAALKNLLAKAMSNYISKNFSHKYLGDRSTLDYTIGSWGSNGSHYDYDCDQIGKIWTTAKCLDFINSSTAQDKVNTVSMDDFFYMSDYKTTDYRKLPTACTISGDWPTKLSVAANDASQYPKETYNTYANFFTSTSCGAVPPIPTGVTVKRPGITDYEEHICVNPGCAYDRSSSCTNSPP